MGQAKWKRCFINDMNFDLSELEKDQLQALIQNEALLRILHKVFMFTAESQKPQIGLLDSNKLLGEKYRAYQTSKAIIGDAFELLLAHKVEKEVKKFTNRAR